MEKSESLYSSLNQNINYIMQQLGASSDLSIQRMRLGDDPNTFFISIIFLSSLADKDKTDRMSAELNKLSELKKSSDNKVNMYFETLLNTPLCGCEVISGTDNEILLQQILFGNTVVLFDGRCQFLSYKTYGPSGRAIEEPTSQTVIRGPKEGFTERIETNISQIRRRIKDKALRIETLNLGTITKTSVALLYIDNIVQKDKLDEIKARINKIQTDSVLESGYIEETIKDDPFSLFPTIFNTERPDSVSSALLEGKIAILVDGTPYALTAPTTFMEFFISSEDYYHHFYIASLFRIIRIISFYLTILVPAIYIALTTYDQELIPTSLLLNIAAQREGVPFPAFLEAIMMELTFEILREAGVRMPRAIGPAISIVGALVLGQAAVQAGLVSAAMVIVVSITAIANFCVPNMAMSNCLRIIRFAFMILAASFGLYGIFIGLIALTLNLCKLKSIGVPYMAPFAPKLSDNNEDNIMRTPFWNRKRRPGLFNSTKDIRGNMGGPVKSEQTDYPEMK